MRDLQCQRIQCDEISRHPNYDTTGIPGVLKNALDWLVASGELYGKPIALFNPSPRTSYAQTSLIETLTVMNARLIPEASINAAPGIGNGEPHVNSNADLSKRIECALDVFVKTIGLASSESMARA